MKQVVIIGAGGCARDVLDVIDAVNLHDLQYEVLGYVVDSQYGSPGTIVNGKPILGDFTWLSEHSEDVWVICAVGPSHQRYQLVRRAERINCRFFSVVHPTAIMTDRVELGQGVVVTAGCILTNQIHIGNHVYVNLGCTIAHDAILENFTTLSPGVHVSGNVTLETGTYVGTGTSIIEKIRIGHWSIIGAGSVVIKDVPPNVTAVGNPARIIKEREDGWHIEIMGIAA